VTTHLLWSMSCHLAKKGLPPWIPCMQAMSSIQGKRPRRIRGWHVDVTWIEGPTGRQTTSKPGGHRGPTLGPTGQPPRESTCRGGPTKGSVDPIGRPNQPCVGSSWPSMWCLLVGSWSTLGVLTPFSRSCPRPINRREGTHVLPNSLSNSSLTFVFQG
jgi:hypothetical protein